MVDAALFSSATTEWSTPQDFFDKLNQEFNFGLDAAATRHNAKCPFFYTEQIDGLKQDWVCEGAVWCNPPYGRGASLAWVKKGYNEAIKHRQTVVMLVPSRTDTRWFHDYVYGVYGVEVRFVKGRLKFGGSKNSAPFPSMVIVFRGAEMGNPRWCEQRDLL